MGVIMINKICANCEKMNSECICVVCKERVHWANTCESWNPRNEVIKNEMSEALQKDLNSLRENKSISYGVYKKLAYEFANEARLAGMDVSVKSIDCAYVVSLN